MQTDCAARDKIFLGSAPALMEAGSILGRAGLFCRQLPLGKLFSVELETTCHVMLARLGDEYGFDYVAVSVVMRDRLPSQAAVAMQEFLLSCGDVQCGRRAQ